MVVTCGNVTLKDVYINDPLPGLSPLRCTADHPGAWASNVCTATYVVTQPDLDAAIVNRAVVSATN